MGETNRQALNRADLNTMMDMLRSGTFGDMLRTLPVHLQGVSAGTTGACAQQLASLGTVVLPEDAKAAVIHRCTVRANSGSVSNGEYTVEAYGTTPATTQVAVAPNGDIVFLGSDGVTQADIVYTPMKGDVLGNVAVTAGQLAASTNGNTSLTLNTPSGIGTLPTFVSGKTKLLMQALANTATNTGQKIILVPATGVVATTKAALSQDGTKVYFNSATDAVTNATVDLLAYAGAGGLTQAGVDINAFLEAINTTFT
jgi:hypothetical protein